MKPTLAIRALAATSLQTPCSFGVTPRGSRSRRRRHLAAGLVAAFAIAAWPTSALAAAGTPTQDSEAAHEAPAATGKPAAEAPAAQIDLAAVDARPLGAAAGDAMSDTSADQDGMAPDGTQDSVEDAIDPCWEVDAWQFHAVAGQSVVITMDRTWGGLDSYMELYNPYGQLRAVDDDSGGNQNARLVGTIGTTGTYVIRAHSFNYGSMGGYRLSVVLGSPNCGSCPPPPCGTCGGSVTVFDAAYYAGNATTVRPNARLTYPQGTATSILFNGACRSGGCQVVVYRYSGWSGQTYRAETITTDQPYIGITYDASISYIEVLQR